MSMSQTLYWRENIRVQSDSLIIAVICLFIYLFIFCKIWRICRGKKVKASEQKLKQAVKHAHTHLVLLSMGRAGDEVADFGAEVLPDGSTHVVNQVH